MFVDDAVLDDFHLLLLVKATLRPWHVGNGSSDPDGDAHRGAVTVLWLRAGLTVEEIAARHDCSVSTVRRDYGLYRRLKGATGRLRRAEERREH